MTQSALASALLGLLLCASSAPTLAQEVDAQELQLQARLQQALWPADIVRVANDYLQAYPGGAEAARAKDMRAGAEETVRALSRNDVHLYRSAFRPTAEGGDAARTVQDDMRRAALGDPAAAVRLAHRHQRGEGGLASDLNRYVGWLQLASELGNEGASYELALYFRKESQPALAAAYETRAEELGFRPPTALDHVRK